MSEALIESNNALTAAVKDLTQILTAVHGKQADLIERVEAKTAELAKPATRSRKAAEEAPKAEDAAPKATETAKAAEPEVKNTAAEHPSIEEVEDAIKAFGLPVSDEIKAAMKANGGKLPEGKWTAEQKFQAAERSARLARVSEIVLKGCGFTDGKLPEGQTKRTYVDVPAEKREIVIKSINAAAAKGNILNPADFKDDADEPAAAAAEEDLF